MCQDNKPAPPPPNRSEATTSLLDDVDPSMPSPPVCAIHPPPKSVYPDSELETTPKDGEVHVASAVEEEEEEAPISDRSVVYGATGAGGLIGAVLGGPVLGLVGAGGGYYCVTRPEGSKVGDAAKGLGKSTVQTYRSAQKFCKKNRVGPKMKAAGSRMYEGAKEINQQYRITERTQSLAVGAYQATKGFNQKHDVTGKVSRGFVAGLNKLAGEKENHDGQQPAADKQPLESPPAREPPAAPTQPASVPVPAATARV
mmetsp:Transcript_8543/g.20838  ORF Transcript_8543/g.20838 Transcript_8543/m.20838 type:complete len:256 (+) Transcript_8543:2-769(+)